jgi:hypothetical protein
VRTLIFAASLCLAALPAVAGETGTLRDQNDSGHHGAPAPLIGFGVEGAIVVGGVLLGSKIVKRLRGK